MPASEETEQETAGAAVLLLSGCAGHPVIQQQAADWQPNISSPQFVLNVLHWLAGPLPD